MKQEGAAEELECFAICSWVLLSVFTASRSGVSGSFICLVNVCISSSFFMIDVDVCVCKRERESACEHVCCVRACLCAWERERKVGGRSRVPVSIIVYEYVVCVYVCVLWCVHVYVVDRDVWLKVKQKETFWYAQCFFKQFDSKYVLLFQCTLRDRQARWWLFIELAWSLC